MCENFIGWWCDNTIVTTILSFQDIFVKLILHTKRVLIVNTNQLKYGRFPHGKFAMGSFI